MQGSIMDFAGIKICDIFKKPGDAELSNINTEIFARTCTEEILTPIEGKLTGEIPKWLNGSLIMNGPGTYTVGDHKLNHVFDGMAILQKFSISSASGKITYQNKMLQSEAYTKGNENNRIIFGEFGTAVASQGLMKKITSFGKARPTDNTLVTVYPLGDNFYALTEAACVNQIDPKTLEILERSYLNRHLGVVIVTAHPHVLSDGSAYNVGHSIGLNSASYNIIHFPKGEKSVEDAKVIATVPARFKYHPAYIHSFGMTEKYFIILESPFVVSVPSLLKSAMTTVPFVQCLMWLKDEHTRIILIDRSSGLLSHTFYADPFFCFHTINQYEKDDEIIFDMCCYENAAIVDAAHFDKMNQNDAENARKIQPKPLRFVLPLKSDEKNLNLVKFKGSSATAQLNEKGEVFCTPEVLSEVGCEFPRVNYPKYLAAEYRYFYAVAMDFSENLGALMKVDTQTKTEILWKEGSSYAWEPIFVPSPNSKDEDDGVVVTAILSTEDAKRVTLIILDAKNMKELARGEFKNLPSAVTKPFHGWFLLDE